MSELTSNDPTHAVLPATEGRNALIRSIIAQDRTAFYSTSLSEPSELVRIPDNALRYFIPPRIFELAENPANVRVVRASGRYLDFAVFERKVRPVSDPAIFVKYVTGPLIEKRLIDINDCIYLALKLRRENDATMWIHDYRDRTEMRRRGVATSFYSRLREIAKSMGFRYIVGQNDTKNISFFINKKGQDRTRLTVLDPWERDKIFRVGPPNENNEITVDFLYPEDKPKFISKQK